MALIDEDPPTTLPRAHSIGRPSMPASGSVKYIQSCMRRVSMRAPAERDVDPGIAIPAAGFEHEHRNVVLGEPVGERAAGRTGADDDEVVARRASHALPAGLIRIA